MTQHRSASHTAQKPQLVIFPGETLWTRTIKDENDQIAYRKFAVGYIYVVNGGGEYYQMIGGPPPGHEYKDVGGHTAEPTPPGHYKLGALEHHTTASWPMSVIPYGAKLREHGGEVQYQVGQAWHTATGRQGRVTAAQVRFWLKSGKHKTVDEAAAHVRTFFYKSDGKLWPVWIFNDFGPKSWCLKKHGHRTPFYIHTTPGNEIEAGLNKPVVLLDSHGCIHIKPSDREEMIKKHYLEEGVEVEVRKYGEKGPP